MAIRGSCLCGEVTFTVGAPWSVMYHCHCSMCRKAHGAAFATYLATPPDSLSLRGLASIKRYASRPDGSRAFCAHCGSVVPPPAGELQLIPAGLLDDDPGVRPMQHVFVGSKAPWHEITDDLPQHEAYPPGFGDSVAPTRPSESAPGEVGGSCLCGGVAYAVDGALAGPIVCCHCKRCQKARAAAHASNTFVALERFRWLRGEALVASYKVPDAKTFTHSFCSICGGGVPRVSVERGRVVIPSPALDDDPGARPELHIFVASQAPWHTISDDLPQYDAYPPGDFPPPSRR